VTARGRIACFAAASLALLAPAAGGAEGTERVSHASHGGDADAPCEAPALSASGRFVAWQSGASNLVADDANGLVDIFLRDRRTGEIARLTRGLGGAEPDSHSVDPALSADGRSIAFVSVASNLVAGDTNGEGDVFVHDLRTGATARVSIGSNGEEGRNISFSPALSASGRYVAFASYSAELVPRDGNGHADVFVHDRRSGITTRVSLDAQGDEANADSLWPSISRSGRFVAFFSDASDLVPGDANGASDVFVHDRRTGLTRRVSVDSGGGEANAESTLPSLSASGRFVAFESDADDLVAGDTNGAGDVFVHDLATGATTRVSVDSAGGQADGQSSLPALSASGRYVAFESGATNLVPDDANRRRDVFVHDRRTGATWRVSVDAAGGDADEGGGWPATSADGRTIAFDSSATDLVPGDGNAELDVFVRARK
jgi:Tol biopolymer transport system component